ncbi:hypothetical protein [Actinoplanes sp. NPDC026623]|uniref:hypothetical protein n=1 Tax=Actinoplanes sp. NPDC026623 TaxID=3155610 RepID=UPI0033E9B7BF
MTDPNFVSAGSRVHLGYGAWTRRLIDPAMTPGDLPPLDGVVLSHLTAAAVIRAAIPALKESHGGEAGIRTYVPARRTRPARRAREAT